MDNIIASRQLTIERKRLIVELCENDRGRYLRITEFAHGHRNAIIVPSPGLPEFTAAIQDVLSQAENTTTLEGLTPSGLRNQNPTEPITNGN